MQHISTAINKFLRKTGLEKAVAQQNALEIWPVVVGENVAQKTIAEKIEHGILVIRTQTPAWRQELSFQKKSIIKKINKKLDKNIIKDIRFI
ncbi:MAG: hypothetical protein CMG74_00045 [Candidatus Marinimicrobia bacterium]|nr:hypothetical protein [Candidatus Neomarinimicrobiota bacterium]|tara:strand:+ start:20625 stop:20900 length:276 start_codon:yes stop_codon:yes gene_type:complete